MPAKTAKQQRFMGMCSTTEGRKKAKDKCPPVKMAKEFAQKPKKRKTSKPTRGKRK